MLNGLLTAIIFLVAYLMPGYAATLMAELRGLRLPGRLFLSLCISLIILPYAFTTYGNAFPFRPGLASWLIFVALLLGAAWLLRRLKLRPVIQVATADGAMPKVSFWEAASVWSFLAVFAALSNLPRLQMFLLGSQAVVAAPYDETYHVAQLVSVARTGIPPLHYLQPALDLTYYYASWIYPALLGNLVVPSISLMRGMSIHSFLQVFIFLGLIYALLAYNFKSWWVRLAGIGCFTLLGGLDLFGSLPIPNLVDAWQTRIYWLEGGFQISQWITLFIWVPHHLAAGMAFLGLLFLWKNIQSSLALKFALSGVLLGFSFTTSPFVFLASAAAFGMAALYEGYRRKDLKQILSYGGLAAALFLLVAWRSFIVYAGHAGGLEFRDFRILVVEILRGTAPWTIALDRALTFGAFPLVASFIGLVEMGLPFILYLAWWVALFRKPGPLFKNTDELLLGIFPLFSFLAVFLIRDQGGGGNFAMRGMIPAQILIVFAGLRALEVLWLSVQAKWKRSILVYLFACFVLIQGISMLVELRENSVDAIKSLFRLPCGLPAVLHNNLEGCLPVDQFSYVYWLNQNTPLDALVLETGPIPPEPGRYRLLERSRFLTPNTIAGLVDFDRDWDFILPEQWNRLKMLIPPEMDILEAYRNVEFRGKDDRPVYLVVWAGGSAPSGAGSPVYQDPYLKIYSLP